MSAIMQHQGVRWITFGWSAFIAENLVMSHNRQWIISEFGDDKYHMAYNCLSTAACSSIAYGYLRHGRHQGPKLYNKGGPLTKLAGFTLQSIGLIGFSQLGPKLQIPLTTADPVVQATPVPGGSQASVPAAAPKMKARCPIDFSPSDLPPDGGLKRVSRHPTFWALGFVGLGAALATPFATHVAMFTMPTVFALIGGAHQDYRYRRGWGGTLTPEMDAKTSNIPFVALLSGKQSWSDLYKELKGVNAGLAVLTCAMWRFRPGMLRF